MSKLLTGTGYMRYLQHILSVYLVQITIGQSSDISTGFSWQGIQIDGFPKDIILTWRGRKYSYDINIIILMCPLIYAGGFTDSTQVLLGPQMELPAQPEAHTSTYLV